MEAAAQTARSVQEQLSAAADIIDGSRIGPPLPEGARRRASAQAQTLVEAGGPEMLAAALAAGVTELLGAIAVDLAARPDATGDLIDRLGDHTGISAVLIGRELVRSDRLLELGTDVAIEVQLALLAALTRTTSLSLWIAGETGEGGQAGEPGSAAAPRAVAQVGGVPGVAADAAGEALAVAVDARPPPRSDGLVTRRVRSLRPPGAVLVGAVSPLAPERVQLLLASAEPVLDALLDRRLALAREESREAMTGAIQRRLARLRFDLHDGPQQDVVLLGSDLRLFRDQLRPLIADDPDRDRVMGRLDDLEAQLVALDGDLRRLSTAVQSPFLATGTLREALGEISLAFAKRTGIEPAVRFAGDLGALSESQQIAVLALVREALSNVRKHSDADHVSITVAADPGGVSVEVSDDGSGFDTEAALVRAARTGHLGLVGMHERVRMLGGRTQIESRPGGPTVISASLPPFGGAPELAGGPQV